MRFADHFNFLKWVWYFFFSHFSVLFLTCLLILLFLQVTRKNIFCYFTVLFNLYSNKADECPWFPLWDGTQMLQWRIYLSAGISWQRKLKRYETEKQFKLSSVPLILMNMLLFCSAGFHGFFKQKHWMVNANWLCQWIYTEP